MDRQTDGQVDGQTDVMPLVAAIGTLAVDGWVVKFETGSGWEGARHCVEVMK